MKRIRFISLTALLLGIAFSAFTGHHKKIKTDDPLWYYKLTTTTGETDRTNYEALDGQDDGCPGHSSVFCVIQAPEFGATGTPDLDHIDGVVSNKP